MWFARLFLLCIGLLAALPLRADDARAGCDSCRIRIDSLQQPVKLAGRWLFTRDDSPQNKDVAADTSAWKLARAPGPWKHIYDDQRNFTVGWYRGTFDFAPSLIGQDVVLLVNAYLARTQVYVDGALVYQRPHDINVERYYSVQPIPVRFKVTQARQVVAMRVQTPVMTGIYQLPLELRAYDPHDLTLVLEQVWGGELRTVAAYVLATFGCFFLLVYAKTRYSLYLVAAAAGVLMFPFFAAPGDYFARIFEPETLLYMQFPGLAGVFFFYLFSQYFHRFTPRLNWVLGGVQALIGLAIGLMAFWPNIDLFQPLRTAAFVLCLVDGLLALAMFAAAVRQRRPHATVLLIAISIFLLAGINDVLLALGVIDSVSVVPAGAAVNLLAILWVAASLFANTFRENRNLVKQLEGLNAGLEGLVSERTAQLREKTHDIQTMLQNMPQGVLTVVGDGRVHPEYSAYLEAIFETTDVAGRSLSALAFSRSSLGADALSQLEAGVGSCIGEDRMNFEFNAHVLPTECDITLPDGRVKSLEFSWSPICNDADTIDKLMLCVRDVTALKQLESEAGARKRELQLIGEILAVTQEKFNDFIDGAQQMLQDNLRLIGATTAPTPDVAHLLFRNMHTIKGNARTYNLLQLTHLVHEAEQAYEALRNASAGWDADALQAQLLAVQQALNEYGRINQHVLGRKGPGRRGSADKFLLVERDRVESALQRLAEVDDEDPAAMRAALHQVGSTLHLVGAEPLPEVLAGIVEALPSLARELGREPPQVHFQTHGLLVRTQASRLLQNVFTHLLRNCVDHGLQPAAARIAQGRPAAGRIDIDVSVDDGWLQLRLRDDGRGMPMARIRQIAGERGCIDAGDQPSLAETAELIFMPGFSTAETVTEVSGRGVGMDAVRKFLEQDGGRIAVRLLGDDEAAEYVPFELLVSLPDRYAASPDAAQSFQALRARSRAAGGALAGGAAVPALS